jgi:hypothetical protein
MTDENKLRPPMKHEVKCWPSDFEAIRSGLLTADIRHADRPYRVNDVLEEHEYDPKTEKYSGRLLRLRITRVNRMAGPRMLCGVGNQGGDDVVPIAVLSFGKIST